MTLGDVSHSVIGAPHLHRALTAWVLCLGWSQAIDWTHNRMLCVPRDLGYHRTTT
jgi:hypothetical protein